MSMSVCLFVNRITRKPHGDLHHFLHVACGHGYQSFSYVMLYISGFVDDVMFSHNDPMARHVYSYKRRLKAIGLSITAEILTRFCSTIKTGSRHCELRMHRRRSLLSTIALSNVYSAAAVYISRSPSQPNYLKMYTRPIFTKF